MGEFNKPMTQEAFLDNFAQIKPLMNATMAYYESSRCLFCYDAPCIKACPTEIDIPLFIRQINNGNLSGAAKTIYASNYFGNTCGKVCPTDVLCEGACVYNEQDVKPIEIGRLQNHATQHAISGQITINKSTVDREEKVAIVGAGPAGISCACELRALGYQVDIYEAKSRSGGLALYGTAPYKIENEEVEAEIAYLQNQFGFNILYDTAISNASSFRQLEENYDAIFLGIGMGGTRPLKLKGDHLEHCIGATEFIAALKMDPLKTYVGKHVVVIGGGNTAMDAASESARMGAESVTLVYRRAKSAMGAYAFELELAKSVGVKAAFEMQPLEIKGDNRVRSILFEPSDKREGQHDGDQSTIELQCDMVILATGQEKQRKLLDQIPLKYDERGRIATEGEGHQCSNPMYFAGGDARNGGAEVVNACAEAKKSAQAIHRFIQSK